MPGTTPLMDRTAPLFVLLDDQATHRQLYFTDPSALLIHRMGEPVEDFFAAITRAQKDGLWLAGHFAYEFAAALEPRLVHLAPPGTELARLGLFRAPSGHPPAHRLYRAAPPEVELRPDWTPDQYRARFDAVQRYLRAGDAYQVNLTFPLRGTARADAAALYAGFRRRQPGRYGAVVSLHPDGGGPEIVSFSPELFFERRGQSMRMRPMKGTRPKGAADDMRQDEKSRAENLMIVDLLRNDLSRLCRPGSVRVPELFAVEEFPTLLQMTSQVTGELRDGVGWGDIFRALFPCGSVTGAPKIRAMEIIHELENGPRGAYCGSIGYIAPDGDAAFSVAIRTAVLEAGPDGGRLRYDVGSGVVLDSDGGDEYRECLLKADILRPHAETRFETLRNGPAGLVRAARHAARLGAALPEISPSTTAQRVRVDLAPDGHVSVAHAALQPLAEPVRLALSRYALKEAVQRTDVKTSQRDFYDGERARLAALCGTDEALFLGPDGNLREGSFTSLFVQSGGRLLTPRGPGLLPGILRAELLERGVAMEADITLASLCAADAVYVGNSLRGLLRAELISPDPA
ncbi:MAG: aminodeoxychorismate synthase component I [Pseudomonadota bacterium]